MTVKEKENVSGEVDQVDESTASETLKPNATKSELLSQMLKVVGGMKKEDLSAFLKKTIDQVGKEDDSVPDTSAANKASVAMKTGAVREDVEGLFNEQEDLTEEFKTKATTLFEAAVENRVSVEVARLEEEFEESLQEQVSASIDELHTQVESYIDYVAEKWVEENRLAIENSYRVEMTESFIRGLKNLFEESYVDVPEDKVDLVSEMKTEIEELKNRLEESSAESIRLRKELQESKLNDVFEEVSGDLADTQVEKFRSLSKNLTFESADEYKEKLQTIKEEYFSESNNESRGSTGLINEEASIGSNDDNASDETVVSPEMKSYFDTISRTIKK